MEYLVSLDIRGIHDYIFGTNKLREIRGASILFDRLNRKIPLNELSNGQYGTQGYDWDAIVLGGGNIKVLFKDKGRSEKFKNFLRDSFRREAPGSRASIFVSRKNTVKEQQWVKRIERELQTKKLLYEERNQIMTSGYFKTCEACGRYPAEYSDTRPEETRYICGSCHEKVNASEKYKDMEIYERLSETRNKIALPKDFSSIGNVSNPEGYMGFIYADANRMGEYLAKIKSFDELKRFSLEIHKANLNATVLAINNWFNDDALPFQVILAGGDDLILALPADKAIDMAIDFCDNFNKNLSPRGISTSAAVVICHDSLPIRNVLDVAESLLKNAKLASRNNGGGTYLDFVVTSGSALEDPIFKREKELRINDSGIHHITKRPYSLGDMKALRKTIRDLKEKDFPKNKLYMLYENLFKGHTQSILDSCYIKTRLSKQHRDLIENLQLSLFPWQEKGINEYMTQIGDTVELYDFIH